MSLKILLVGGLIAVLCGPLAKLWGSSRQRKALPASKEQHIVYRELSASHLQKSLDVNGSAVHLKDVVPVVVEIPVYMHVVSAAPSAVTDATLRRQLEILNEDYAPSGIHFNLGGITRTKHEAWARHEDKLILHQSLRVGTYNTLNLFYIDFFHHNHNNLATTTYPSDYALGSEDFWLDGYTLHSGTLPGGSFVPYDLGRTTTHEVGHWLGLYHTFEGSTCDGDGDFVEDTPVQAVAATKGCSTIRHNSCPGTPGWDDVTNVMDNGDDACMDGFTAGQARRMHMVWKKYRTGR